LSAKKNLLVNCYSEPEGGIMGTLTDNDTGGLVAGNQRELGDELALVDVQVSTADTARLQNTRMLNYARIDQEEGNDLP
jgi:hypothetical protein